MPPEPDGAKAEMYFDHALEIARAAGKVVGTARGDEHGAAVARSGQTAALIAPYIALVKAVLVR